LPGGIGGGDEQGGKMPDQMINIKFDVSNEILGSDVEFHDGSKLRLGPERTEEELFRDAKTGKLLNTRELISYLLMKTGVTVQSLIKPAATEEALEKGICVGKPNLEISFTPGSEIFDGDDTGRDIKRVVFDVKLTVRPKKNA